MTGNSCRTTGTPEFEAAYGRPLQRLRLTQEQRSLYPFYVAPLGERRFLIAELLQGLEETKKRFPKLEFRNIFEPDAFQEREIQEAFRQ